MSPLLSLGLLVSFSLFGYLFPQLFAPLKGAVVPLLALIMLSMGFTLKEEDFEFVRRRPWAVLYGALLQFTLMPLLALFVSRLFSLEEELFVGMVLVGSAPGGTASNLITYLSGGDLPYSVAMTSLSTLLSPLLTPLLVYALAGKVVEVPFWGMVFTTLKVVVLPLFVGFGLRKLFGRKERVEALLPYCALLSVAFILAVIFALNANRLPLVSLKLTLAVLLHVLGGFSAGYLLGLLSGMDSKRARTLAVEVGMQNSGLSSLLALKFFTPLTALPSALFSLLQNAVGVFFAFLFRKASL